MWRETGIQTRRALEETPWPRPAGHDRLARRQTAISSLFSLYSLRFCPFACLSLSECLSHFPPLSIYIRISVSVSVSLSFCLFVSLYLHVSLSSSSLSIT